MGIKKYRPTTPSRRWTTMVSSEDISSAKPYKPLTAPLKKKGGRNFQGKITVSHQGGGHKRRYRIIDFKRDKKDTPARVISIEYDPNRSARIALIEYEDSEKRYIVAPAGIKIDDRIISSDRAEIKDGNACKIRNIPTGTFLSLIHISEPTRPY